MTRRLKLGTLVAGNPYRSPALVAKMAAEIDQASKGRLIIGLGAGWFEREHRAYGWDFASMKERQDRLEEACALIRRLFTADEPVDFQGEYYRLERAPLAPGCYQQPHVPIMVGGNGERRTCARRRGTRTSTTTTAGPGWISRCSSTSAACSHGTATTSAGIPRKSS